MPKEKTNAEERLENEGGPPPTVTIKSDKLGHMINEIDPVKDSRYRIDLRAMAKKEVPALGRTFNGTSYIIGENGEIARKGVDGPPNEIKNSIDWSEVQLSLVQFDIVLTSASYFHRRKNMGKDTQEVLNQFDIGASYENLGDWRVKQGLKRNLDVAVLSGSLDFDFPEFLTEAPRKLFIYTTSTGLDSKDGAKFRKMEEFKRKGAVVVVSESPDKKGALRVDGMKLSKDLHQRGYLLAKNMAGPSVLNTLLEANALDLMFITLVHRKLDDDPENLITIPINLKNKATGFEGFSLLRGFAPEVAVAKDGTPITQEFLVYENKNAAHG